MIISVAAAALPVKPHHSFHTHYFLRSRAVKNEGWQPGGRAMEITVLILVNTEQIRQVITGAGFTLFLTISN